MDINIKQNIERLLAEKETTKFAICLDWLALYFKQAGLFAAKYEEGDTVIINDDLYLLEINRPTLHFNTHFVIIYKKEECGHVLLHPRNEMFFKPDTVKVEFANHTLYSGHWQDVYNTLTSWGLQYHAASRIDIAIDNVGYLYELMNIYAKQTPANRTMILKNSSETRALFAAKVLNTENMMFQNFNIGSGGGNKMVTIYNKSLELVRSGKDYIQEYWRKNGVIVEKENLKKLQKTTLKTDTHLKGRRNIYRFELRLKSESIKEIEGFSIDMLKTAAGLSGIVKTHTKKYFDACYFDNRNISKCTPFELLPLDKLGAETIEKIARQENDGKYKAKLTVHSIIQDIHKGYIRHFAINEAIETLIDRVIKYRLQKYYKDHIEQWQRKYGLMVEKDRFNEVYLIISEISKRVAEISATDDDLGNRNDQPDSTASFGDDDVPF